MKRIIALIFLNIIAHLQAMENLWTTIHEKAVQQYWGATESLSGTGSSLEQTATIRSLLPSLITHLNITTILDLPCGDFNWMRYVDFGNCNYIGADIVSSLIEQNNNKYGNNKRTFLHLDVTKDNLPQCDLIICRDLLVHLSPKDIWLTLQNFKKSGAKYLLTTTFVSKHRSTKNQEIHTGGWHPLNLQNKPYNLPEPELIINERCTEQNGIYNDKSLGLWRLESINIPNSI